jgi:hypothetical protein
MQAVFGESETAARRDYAGLVDDSKLSIVLHSGLKVALDENQLMLRSYEYEPPGEMQEFALRWDVASPAQKAPYVNIPTRIHAHKHVSCLCIHSRTYLH